MGLEYYFYRQMKITKHTVPGFLLMLLLFLASHAVMAQQTDVDKIQLANRYYQVKDFGKAAVLFNELFERSKSSYYFNMYLTCLIENSDFENAEKEIRKALRRTPVDVGLYVQWADLLKRQNNQGEAEKKLQQALAEVPASRADYSNLANSFLMKGNYDYAEKLYVQASKKMPGETFQFELGQVYLVQRNYMRMFEVYLDLIKTDEKNLPRMQSAVGSAFRLDVDNSLREQLRAQVLTRMQKEPSVLAYNRLLIWLFLQEKNYTRALRQQIALDKRSGDESSAIMDLAYVATRNIEFAEALKAYDYMLTKGESHPYYQQAKLFRLDVMYRQYEAKTTDAISAAGLQSQFEKAIDEFGISEHSQTIVLDFAHLLTFDLNQADEAVALLQRSMAVPGLRGPEVDELKTALADVYVFQGDFYEAILLYSQVIETNKTNELGDDVKLKKARLGYYMGELSWAKAQLDVLKASTSKLIANDAMELDVFIGNNLNMDTTSVPLQLFARADLELFRNHPDGAWALLDSLQTSYPHHSLQDDIYFRKALISKKRGLWLEAITFLEQILAEYPFDLLADDALMELGDLYRTGLNDLDKAQDSYLRLIEKYPGSVHVTEAREWFRKLRGDFSSENNVHVPSN